MGALGILLSCVIGALILMSFGLGIHALILGHVYQVKVLQVKALAGNRWDGKNIWLRFAELDKDYQGAQLLATTVANILTILYIQTGFGHPVVSLLAGAALAVYLFIKQVKVLRLLRVAVEDDFQLESYLSYERFSFLMEINDEQPPNGMISTIIAKRVIAPNYLESLFVLDDLLNEAYWTRALLKKNEHEEEFEMERAELINAYLTSCETLRPLLYTLLMAVGHDEQVSEKELKRKELKDRAMTLHRMASIFGEKEQHFDNPACLDLNQLIADNNVPIELKEKARETLETIQQKIEDALFAREDADKRLDAEASIETARRLYGITD